MQRAKLSESTEDLYDSVMNLNVKSMWFLTQAVVPSMIEKKSGVIVNVGSIAARNGGGPGATIYAAAKAAVATFTKGWAKELAPHGIRVNAVSPGTVDNYFHEKHSNRQILDNVIAATPAGRLATNEDISDVIFFLCSEAAATFMARRSRSMAACTWCEKAPMSSTMKSSNFIGATSI